MRELIEDLWTLHATGYAVAVTTNGRLRKDGKAHLGWGCSRQAQERFGWFSKALGVALQIQGNHVAHLGSRIVSFPVEHDPYELSDPTLIERSAKELVVLATAEHWTNIALPRPGCGGGGLVWHDVRRLLKPYLDDRFVVVTRDESTV